MSHLPDNIIEKIENFPTIKLAPFKRPAISPSLVGPSRYTNVPRSFPPDCLTRDNDKIMVSARSVSTYPVKSGMVLADPICDCFFYRDFENRTIVGLFDGCSTGNRTKDASDTGCFAFMEYLTESLVKCKDLKSLGQIVIKGFYKAHEEIIKANNSENTTESGSCFASVGVISQLKSEKSAQRWAMVCGVLGNVKVFHVPKNLKIRDVTRDPGKPLKEFITFPQALGRLGGSNTKEPDMKGFRIICIPCSPEDQFLFASQGLWANHIPEVKGKLPSDFSIDCDTWESTAFTQIESVFLDSIVQGWKDTSTTISPSSVVGKLLDYSFEITETRRLDFKSLSSPNSNFEKWPGIVDHTTALVLKVAPHMKQIFTPKPLPTRASSQKIIRADMAAKPVAKLIETEWILDKCLQQMMNHFYLHLRFDPGLSRAEALRLAQNEIKEIYPNPSYRFGENFLPNEDTLSSPNIKMQFWKQQSQTIHLHEDFDDCASSVTGDDDYDDSSTVAPTIDEDMSVDGNSEEDQEKSTISSIPESSSLETENTLLDISTHSLSSPVIHETHDSSPTPSTPSTPSIPSSLASDYSSLSLSPSSPVISTTTTTTTFQPGKTPQIIPSSASTPTTKKKKAHTRTPSVDADVAAEIRKKKGTTKEKDKKTRLSSLFGLN